MFSLDHRTERIDGCIDSTTDPTIDSKESKSLALESEKNLIELIRIAELEENLFQATFRNSKFEAYYC